MLNKPIRKKITFTEITTVIYNPTIGQVEPFKKMMVKGKLDEKQALKHMNNLFDGFPIIVVEVKQIDKYYEMDEDSFITNAKEITEEESKNYYIKKKK